MMAADEQAVEEVLTRSGLRKTVLRDRLAAAASSVMEIAHVRATALVDGRRVPAVELVAAAAGLEASDLRISEAVRVLQSLGIEVEREQAGRRGAAAGQALTPSASPPEADRPAAPSRSLRMPSVPAPMLPDEPAVQPLFFPEALRAVRRHRGEWVALRGDQVVGSGASMRAALRAAAADAADPVKVLFVPGPDRTPAR